MQRAFALALLLATSPAFAETSQWQGQTVALSALERGILCESGPLTLTIDGEAVSATLADIVLEGTLAADGALQLNGRKGSRIYSFTGKRVDGRLSGVWIEAGSGCGGTWRAASPAEQ